MMAIVTRSCKNLGEHMIEVKEKSLDNQMNAKIKRYKIPSDVLQSLLK